MSRLSPLYRALLHAEGCAEQLARVRRTVQYVRSLLPRTWGAEQPLLRQLTAVLNCLRALAAQLGRAWARPSVQPVTAQVAQATVTAQEVVAPAGPTPERLGRLATQVDTAQATLQHVITQLDQQLEQSPEGRFLEGRPGSAG